MSPYGVGTNVYTTVLAYRSDAFKGRKAPQSWADFWNFYYIPETREQGGATATSLLPAAIRPAPGSSFTSL